MIARFLRYYFKDLFLLSEKKQLKNKNKNSATSYVLITVLVPFP